MMKTLKKYRAPYLFILPFFILFSSVPAGAHHMDGIHQLHGVEGYRNAQILRT